MIVVGTITINGKEYKHTYSDGGYMIERDGVRYEEAIDPLDSDRVYTETDIYTDGDDNATEADYLAALAKLGVSE